MPLISRLRRQRDDRTYDQRLRRSVENGSVQYHLGVSYQKHGGGGDPDDADVAARNIFVDYVEIQGKSLSFLGDCVKWFSNAVTMSCFTFAITVSFIVELSKKGSDGFHRFI